MKSGFVPVVGRPNVGKSTLVNALVGQKVSITSSRPQTTRNAIRGVVTIGEPPHSQLILVDTPGLHKPQNALGERLNRLVYGTLSDADAILFLIDATQKVGPGDRMIAERLAAVDTDVILIVNKVDRSDGGQIAERLTEASLWDFSAYVPISALDGDGVDRVTDELVRRMPEGPMYFPADAVSDQPEELLIAEIVREKFLDRLREELPHSLTVRTTDLEIKDNGTMHIGAQVVVERDSQKGIVIGKGASVLKAAGAEARIELEAIFATKVYLELRVTVEKDWQRHPQLLDRLGF
ncbi:MAG TPA: GTPase Era [Actinobacteria bacterium]|nr:GTPase Era [Actinomycetota bacterium]